MRKAWVRLVALGAAAGTAAGMAVGMAAGTAAGPAEPLAFTPGALLPGPLSLAWGFKAASTLDSMLGYRRGRLRWLGTAGARLDDALERRGRVGVLEPHHRRRPKQLAAVVRGHLQAVEALGTALLQQRQALLGGEVPQQVGDIDGALVRTRTGVHQLAVHLLQQARPHHGLRRWPLTRQ